MMKTPMMVTMMIAAVSITQSLFSATFVVPSDDELIAGTDLIVSATCIDSYTRLNDADRVETVVRLSVDELISGDIFETLLDVIEPGGVLGNSWMILSGSPRYDVGERYLVFLERHGEAWRTRDMVLGQFRFRRDSTGRQLLIRDTTEIVGWHSSGQPFEPRYRAAEPFIEYIRAVSRGEPAETSYLVSPPELVRASAQDDEARLDAHQFVFELNRRPARRNDPSEVWKIHGSIDGLDLRAAADQAAGFWSKDASSEVDYRVDAGTSTDDSWGDDGESRIIANDPDDQVSGTFGTDSAVIAAAFTGCRNCSEHVYNGLVWVSIAFADIVINDGVSGSTLSQSAFRTAVAHELGHTLGFRHSNQGLDGQPCDSNQACSDMAVMSSWISSSIDGALQPWDVAALRSVYGQGSTCEIQPLMVPDERIVVDPGQSVTLSIDIFSPIAPTIQWFEGNVGDESAAVGSSSRHLMLGQVLETRSFWVRVSNGCDTWESGTITVVIRSGRRRGAR